MSLSLLIDAQRNVISVFFMVVVGICGCVIFHKKSGKVFSMIPELHNYRDNASI